MPSHPQPRLVPHRGVPPVGTDHEAGVHLEWPVRALRPDADDGAAGAEQLRGPTRGQQTEGLQLLGAAMQQREEVPLRHECEVRTAHRQMREVRQREAACAERHLDAVRALVGQGEEVLQQPDLRQQLEGRGVDGVAPEVPQEVLVLLQDEDPHPLPGQQETRDHARRPAAHDADVGGQARADIGGWAVAGIGGRVGVGRDGGAA